MNFTKIHMEFTFVIVLASFLRCRTSLFALLNDLLTISLEVMTRDIKIKLNDIYYSGLDIVSSHFSEYYIG